MEEEKNRLSALSLSFDLFFCDGQEQRIDTMRECMGLASQTSSGFGEMKEARSGGSDSRTGSIKL